MNEELQKTSELQPLLHALGRAISRRRLSAHMTQLMLAHEVGVTRSYMSDIERGLRNVTLNTLDSIATALRTTPGKLLREAEKIEQSGPA